METLYIESTKSTPEVHFAPDSNRLMIKGQSYPENAFRFYEPIMQWLEAYLAQLSQELVVELYFNMPYINTSSSKCMMMILEKLDKAYQDGKQVKICWYYNKDNETSLECAEEFKEDLEIPFLISAVEDEE